MHLSKSTEKVHFLLVLLLCYCQHMERWEWGGVREGGVCSLTSSSPWKLPKVQTGQPYLDQALGHLSAAVTCLMWGGQLCQTAGSYFWTRQTAKAAPTWAGKNLNYIYVSPPQLFSYWFYENMSAVMREGPLLHCTSKTIWAAFSKQKYQERYLCFTWHFSPFLINHIYLHLVPDCVQ